MVFINNKQDYYYSLVYHAILQKKELSFDYLYRLNDMAKSLSIKAFDEKIRIISLIEFMQSNHYAFTYPYDIWVPLRVEFIPNKMFNKNIEL